MTHNPAIIGFGTGTRDGEVQSALGKEQFISLVRYAFERGIRLFDTAPVYSTFDWMGEALSGLPREQLFIQCKLSRLAPCDDAQVAVDIYRSKLKTDYLNSLLIHCATDPQWPTTYNHLIESMVNAKLSGSVAELGCSVHNLPALRCIRSTKWIDVLLARCNPFGIRVDGETGMDAPNPSVFGYDPATVLASTDIIRRRQLEDRLAHCFAMKIMCNGDTMTADQRKQSLHFVLGLKAGDRPLFDGLFIGFKSTAEIDEVLTNLKEWEAQQ